MSLSYYEGEVRRLENELNRLQQDMNRQNQEEVRKQAEKLRIRDSITAHTSPGILKSKLQQIERLDKDLAAISKRKTEIYSRIASKTREQEQKKQQLGKERQREQDQVRRAQQRRESELQGQVTELAAQTAELRNELQVVYDTEAILAEVYVLESEAEAIQGTCFNLAGVGLVTCAHVLRPGLYAFSPSDVARRYPVEVLSSNPAVDIAIVQAPELELGEGLPKGSADDAQQMDEIIVAGYPNYRLGDSGVVMPGSVTGFRTVSGIRRILVSASIVAGSSGGPVLNKQGHVIGIAVTGADRMEDAGETEHHGVVPIDALTFLQENNHPKGE